MAHAGEEVFIVDASALIDFWQKFYRPAQFPTFWKRFAKGIEDERLVVCSHVMNEVKGAKDLHGWLRQSLSGRVLRPNAAVLDSSRTIIETHYVDYLPHMTHEYADPLLIAYGAENGWTVLTAEGRAGGKSKAGTEPKIPDVCDEEGVGWCAHTRISERMGWKF